MSTPTDVSVSNVSSSKTPAIAEGIEVPAFTDDESSDEECPKVARHLPAEFMLNYIQGARHVPRKFARGDSLIRVRFGADIVREISRLDQNGNPLPSGSRRRATK